MRAGFSYCDARFEYEQGGKELDVEGMKDFLKGWLPHLAHLKTKNVDQSVENEFLQEIVHLYFSKLGKEIGGKVRPVIAQNNVIAYVNKSSFFQAPRDLDSSSEKTTEIQKQDLTIGVPRSRL